MERKDFLSEVMEFINENLSDERFGVAELAGKMNMSRSGLLRKLKKYSDQSINQLIRNTRLEKGRELLKNSTLTVSEVAFAVGFSSSSYFIKCFHDHYGYPPGQMGKIINEEEENIDTNVREKIRLRAWLFPALFLIFLLGFLLVYLKPFSKRIKHFEKTIAVLPFINDSNDSSNVYLINGLMESILNNLQKVEDLHVLSRTSVEKFRTHSKTIPELSKALKANYFVEGSGQKVGEEILLHIQLIEAPTDRHLWAGSFRRKSSDIFQLQQEISKTIADKVEAIITPEEADLINKIPTTNIIAYDHFLKGLDLLNGGTASSVEASLPFFKEAIREDKQFARAYSAIAIAYYFMDATKADKKYSDTINEYADKSLFYDTNLPQGQIAKALYYINENKYEKALPYFEKALELNPNSDLALGFLTDFYANYFPDTEKYLEYALKSTKLDIASKDSLSASYIYLHLANAFIQSGFIEEAEKYINISMKYDATNIFSEYVKAYIDYAVNKDLLTLNSALLTCIQKDTNRYDVLQEVGKSYYYLRDYHNAYKYYRKYLDIVNYLKLNVYNSEYAKIAMVMKELGRNDESMEFYGRYKEYADADQSLYRELSLAIWCANNGKTDESFDHLNRFAEEENFHYWTLLFLPIDPLIDEIEDNPRYSKIFEKIKEKFWQKHMQIRSGLEEKELI